MTGVADRLLTEPVSGCTSGAALEILTDYTSAADVTTVHASTDADNEDIVYLKAWNNHTSAVDVVLILNPSDETSTTEIDKVSVKTTLAPKSWTWLLEGERFRLRSGVPYMVAAYVDTATATAKYVRVVGWFQRLTQDVLTP